MISWPHLPKRWRPRDDCRSDGTNTGPRRRGGKGQPSNPAGAGQALHFTICTRSVSCGSSNQRHRGVRPYMGQTSRIIGMETQTTMISSGKPIRQ